MRLRRCLTGSRLLLSGPDLAVGEVPLGAQHPQIIVVRISVGAIRRFPGDLADALDFFRHGNARAKLRCAAFGSGRVKARFKRREVEAPAHAAAQSGATPISEART